MSEPAHVRLAGWSSSLAGKTIEYHSPYPGVRRALLCRAMGSRMAIAWRTAPCPRAAVRTSDAPVSFLWLAGLATGKGAHSFTLTAGGLRGGPAVFTFRTDGAREWHAGSPCGASLSFTTTLVDQFDELFGIMSLTLPAAVPCSGSPLEIAVEAGDAGSDDWFMTFEHPLADWVHAEAEPALLNGPAGLLQPILVEISRLGAPTRVAVEVRRMPGRDACEAGEAGDAGTVVDAGDAVDADAIALCAEAGAVVEDGFTIATGHNEIRVPVPAVDSPAVTGLIVRFADGTPDALLTVEQRPVRMREICLLPHPHLDIGYTNHQDEVEKRHWAHLDDALSLAHSSGRLPEKASSHAGSSCECAGKVFSLTGSTGRHPREARFRWNVEQLWAVESWWRRASPGRREELAEAVRQGYIGLQAMLAGVLTGLCGPEELRHLTDFSRELSREIGVVIDTAMITDIPGQSWGLVPALAEAGVRYLSSGPNYMPGLADGGDRIGGILKAWGDRPVWWESQSGEERILFWMAGRGYSWFHGLNGASIDPERPRPLMEYLSQLEEAEYPYDLIQVRYTIGGDNGPPDPTLPGSVAAWNERYASPRLRIATTGGMFREMERRHGNEIPTVRGDFTPYWEDGAASSAAETAMNRNSANRLVQAESLWRSQDAESAPAEEFTAAWRKVVLFSEHTWGAAESVSDPDSPHVRAQWEYKRGLALDADRMSRELMGRAMETAAGTRQVAGRGPGAEAGPGAGAVPGAGSGADTMPGPSGSPRGSYGHLSGACTVTVFNTLGWPRSGVVRVPERRSGAGDRVLDSDGRPVPSQRLTGGELAFLAEDLPAGGMRRYSVVAGGAFAPAAGSEADCDGLSMRNGRLSAAVDPETGAVLSLIRLSSGVELVDRSLWPGLNAWLYIPGRDPRLAIGITGQDSVEVTIGERGPLVASLRIRSEAPGAMMLQRELSLAAGSDCLEIDNLIDKIAVREKESVHIAFPFLVPGGLVQLDLGGIVVRPDLDQVAGACRDWFCVHSGVEVANRDIGVILTARDAPLVEIGALTDEMPRACGRRGWRSGVGESQTIFSYVMNNYWHTNYRAEQEGLVRLRYSVRPFSGKGPGLTAQGRSDVQPLLVF